MSEQTLLSPPAASAFDSLAQTYDDLFTNSPVGRTQREAVWAFAAKVFRPGMSLLELNCGTGEDALHFAEQGLRVMACDGSSEMIFQAEKKTSLTETGKRIRFFTGAIEELSTFEIEEPVDAVFSNFSGLNCVQNLATVAAHLAAIVAPNASLILCFSTRFCLWEFLWYGLRADLSRASRRWAGHHETKIGGVTFPVFYPTLREIQCSFAPHFEVRSVHGIGVSVPPSYANSIIAERPRLLQFLKRVDATISSWPGFRMLGDHMLIHLQARGEACI